MFRYSVLIKTIKTRMKSLTQPHGIFVPRYGEKAINDDMLIGIMVFIGLYFFSAGILTLILSLFGLDLVTCLSGAIATISNVGPALGHMIGPDKTFALLPDAAKWILSFAMLLGRLEFITVIMVFFPYIWKRNI
jgi:trk system potassium uptake protein TrkH